MNEIYLVVAVPIIRGVAGWLQNALEDGKIDAFEWRKLASTMLRLGIPAFALYWGLDLDVEVAASLPLIIDYLLGVFSQKLKTPGTQ
jgi:TRAP-type mannitol/chloroaromatic compound transport system substrate-binding protein